MIPAASVNQSMQPGEDEMQRAIQASLNVNQGGSKEDVEMNKAIMESIKAANTPAAEFEPLSIEHRMRENGQQVGLQNIGNTCYFNSILQVYYNIPQVVSAILEFKDDEPPLAPGPNADNEEKNVYEKLEKNRQLILNLKILFG